MQLFVEGLDLVAQGQDIRIRSATVAVDPLSEDTGGRVGTAGKFGIGIQRVAQSAGPFVMGCLGSLYGGQQVVDVSIISLHILNAENVYRHDTAEQNYGSECRNHSDSNVCFNTFSHKCTSFR